MRVHALSDLHLEYADNRRWLSSLSVHDYQRDVLILAGDLAASSRWLAYGFAALVRRFRHVLYVPGNHELWIESNRQGMTSFDKFEDVRTQAREHGVTSNRMEFDGLTIVPLFAWYDYSFGLPSDELQARWMDYRACRWPEGTTTADVTRRFMALNDVDVQREGAVITFSHFLPRIDLMPASAAARTAYLYPVLGAAALDAQLRRAGSIVHVYGHSHLNRDVAVEGTRYVNNAFGYPNESRIAAKQLRSIYEHRP
jgi:predicted phosphodiesterase